jgi:Cu(I)/Ag(I) efflux system membrane fusion protein
MSRNVLLAAGFVTVVGFAAYGGYRYARHDMAEQPVPAQADAGRKVLYWYDPMYPAQKFDKPGKSPFMDMQLVPRYADEAAGAASSVAIAPQTVQNLGVRTAEAASGRLERRLEAVGAVGYNERAVVQLQARAAGFVEKLYARAPLDPVRKGAPLVEILYPEWAGAQEEYLLLRRQGPANEALAQAARQRLLLLGMSEAEIAAVERDGKPRTRQALVSPVSGVVAELGVREGMTVAQGMPLFRLVDLSTVWVNAEIPEAQAALVRPGSKVEARVAGYSDAVFNGRVGAILPEVSAATRTLKARVELANADGRLVPGMFATLAFLDAARGEAVLVPSEAVIRTGERDVIIVALGAGSFQAKEVQVGAEAGGKSEIRKGIAAGEKVVLSGQFLIDSEASLAGALARLSAPAAASTVKGRGKVLGMDAKTGRVELEHDPIPELQWPSMTMEFAVRDKAQAAALKPGARVEFEMRREPDKDGTYLIEAIR